MYKICQEPPKNIVRAVNKILEAQLEGRRVCNLDMPAGLYPEVVDFIKCAGFNFHCFDYSINIFLEV